MTPTLTSSSWSAPTTFTAWTSPRWWNSTWSGRQRHCRGDPPADAMADQFGVIEVDQTIRRNRRIREKPANPRACPADPASSSPRWATTSSTPMRLVAVARRRRARGHQARHGRRHLARLRQPRRGRRLRLHPQRDPRSTERDRTYWRDVGTIDSYYDAHMDLISSTRSSTSTTPNGRCTPARASTRRRSSCAAAGTASAMRSTPRSSPRRRHLGRHVYALGALSARPGALLREPPGLRPARQRGDRPARARPARHHRQERRLPAGTPDRPRPRARPCPRLPGDRDGHRRARQGPGRHRDRPTSRSTSRKRFRPSHQPGSASRCPRSTPRGPRSARPPRRWRRWASTSCSTGTTSSR